mmetsp:Transcript_45465/g.132321  ORF Transcript_45465/g.132321 Transcript_45465/m.132321 type:complete len:239 (+) Transcript_45465:1897-2613(+)
MRTIDQLGHLGVVLFDRVGVPCLQALQLCVVSLPQIGQGEGVLGLRLRSHGALLHEFLPRGSQVLLGVLNPSGEERLVGLGLLALGLLPLALLLCQLLLLLGQSRRLLGHLAPPLGLSLAKLRIAIGRTLEPLVDGNGCGLPDHGLRRLPWLDLDAEVVAADFGELLPPSAEQFGLGALTVVVTSGRWGRQCPPPSHSRRRRRIIALFIADVAGKANADAAAWVLQREALWLLVMSIG